MKRKIYNLIKHSALMALCLSTFNKTLGSDYNSKSDEENLPKIFDILFGFQIENAPILSTGTRNLSSSDISGITLQKLNDDFINVRYGFIIGVEKYLTNNFAISIKYSLQNQTLQVDNSYEVDDNTYFQKLGSEISTSVQSYTGLLEYKVYETDSGRHRFVVGVGAILQNLDIYISNNPVSFSKDNLQTSTSALSKFFKKNVYTGLYNNDKDQCTLDTNSQGSLYTSLSDPNTVSDLFTMSDLFLKNTKEGLFVSQNLKSDYQIRPVFSGKYEILLNKRVKFVSEIGYILSLNDVQINLNDSSVYDYTSLQNIKSAVNGSEILNFQCNGGTPASYLGSGCSTAATNQQPCNSQVSCMPYSPPFIIKCSKTFTEDNVKALNTKLQGINVQQDFINVNLNSFYMNIGFVISL